MSFQTLRIAGLAILVGLFLANHHSFLSGMNPVLGFGIIGFFLILLVWGIVLIYRESNRRQRWIQIVVLLAGLLYGIAAAATKPSEPLDQPVRRYYHSGGD